MASNTKNCYKLAQQKAQAAKANNLPKNKIAKTAPSYHQLASSCLWQPIVGWTNTSDIWDLSLKLRVSCSVRRFHNHWLAAGQTDSYLNFLCLTWHYLKCFYCIRSHLRLVSAMIRRYCPHNYASSVEAESLKLLRDLDIFLQMRGPCFSAVFHVRSNA